MKSSTTLAILCSAAIGLMINIPLNAQSGRGHAPRPHAREHHPNSPHQPGPAHHPSESPGDHARDPGVDRRQENQRERVAEGVHSGQLTKEEAKELTGTEQKIRQEERAYKSDGVLTKEERKDLHQDLNEASREIYQEKHDAETRPGVTPAEPRPYSKDPGVNARQENQQHRIAEGVRSGELTKREAHRLEEREAHLARMERRLKEDGSLTPAERERLQRRLHALSAEIYKQKHDAQERPKAN